MKDSGNFEQRVHERMRLFAEPSAGTVALSRDHVREGVYAGRRTALEHALTNVLHPDSARIAPSTELSVFAALIIAALGVSLFSPMDRRPERQSANPVGDLRPQPLRPSLPQQEVFVPPSVEPSLAFEVAAIRRDEPPRTYLRFQAQNDRFISEGTTLLALIRYAYNVESFQVVGGPDWVTDRDFQFHIQAKAERPASTNEMRRMLQSLLADRFKLKLTHQPKQSSGYVVRIDKNGSKVKKTGGLGPEGCFPFPARCTRTTMTGFAEYLSSVVFMMPVVDRTSLSGEFDLNLEWRPDSSQFGGNGGVGFFAGNPAAASIFTAIKEQLGLTLEPGTVPTEMLVIDHAEMPSDN